MRIVLVEFTWQANKIINNKEYYKNDVIVSLDPGSSYIFKVNNIEYLENSHFCNHNKLWENYKNITDQSLKITKVLDEALYNFGTQLINDTGIDIMETPGSGAAGGIGGGMVGFLNAQLKPGVDIVLDTLGFDKSLKNVNLVITGEGQIDFQTVFSKAPIGVAKHAKKYNIPVIAICGSLGKNYQDVHSHGIDAVISIIPKPMTLKKATDNAYELIANTSEQLFRVLKNGQLINN